MNYEIGPVASDARSPLTTVFRKLRKALGTRVGMLQDWRQASTSGQAARRKNALRDGR